MSDLPKSAPGFKGKIGRLISEAEPSRLALSQPAKGKPNVLLIMLDDVGFGSCSTFGGPVPTPATIGASASSTSRPSRSPCATYWPTTSIDGSRPCPATGISPGGTAPTM